MNKFLKPIPTNSKLKRPRTSPINGNSKIYNTNSSGESSKSINNYSDSDDDDDENNATNYNRENSGSSGEDTSSDSETEDYSDTDNVSNTYYPKNFRIKSKYENITGNGLEDKNFLDNWEYLNNEFHKTFYFPFFLYKKQDFRDWMRLIPITLSSMFDCKEMCAWFAYGQDNAKKIFVLENCINNNKNINMKITNTIVTNIENCNSVTFNLFSNSNTNNNNQKRSSTLSEWNFNLDKFEAKKKQFGSIFIYKCLILVLFYFVKFFKYNYPNVFINFNIESISFSDYWNALSKSELKTNQKHNILKYFIENNVTINDNIFKTQ